MNPKKQKPNLRAEKNQSAGFLIWIISAVYLLAMVWLLLSKLSGYGAPETQPWLVAAVVALTVSYGILTSLLMFSRWQHERPVR